MLPSRGIARSLPSVGAWSQTPNRLVVRKSLRVNLTGRKIANGRQFGTSLRSNGGGLTSSSPFRPRYVVAPIVLGGVSTSRNLSIWGWGSKSAPPAEESATPEAATEPVPTPVEQPVEAVAAPIDATTAAATTPAAEPVVPITEVDLSAIINAEDILNMPEDLGYLHAIGLDYGWGFTSTMQWALEHLHVYSGLGWGASIMATAVLLRAIMFYPQLKSLQFNAVMQKLRKDPRSQEALKMVQQGFQDRDMEMRQKGQVLNKLLRQEYGVSNWGILWGFMQIPFTFGLFRIVSGMTNIPVPSLENAGYLWFTDLTSTDPYFILPAAGTAMMMGALIVNSLHTPVAQKKMLKPMMYIFGSVGFIGTTFLSSAVNLMTVSLGAATLLTALLLNITSIRRALNLPILTSDAAAPNPNKPSYEAPRTIPTTATTVATTATTTTATTSQPAITGVREQLTNSLNDMKKGFSESIGSYTGTYQGTDQEKAERKRKDMIRKLEQMRKDQEREEFEKKYKSKK
ncbi:Mitochondrial inner membrane OXA1-like protein [Cladobotryum mycophilum]|uniref:Mitochondrial inner membrane OXA1-like protein n=1 Tax=Cladobotryum mycophilum TaxID=491253 RepID=A0ABR0SNN6_9HYPO